MRKFSIYSAYFAILAIVSMGHVQAACGGGGFKTAGKTTRGTAVPIETASVPAADAVYTSLDNTHFDSMSSTLSLSKGQSKQISNAVNEINDKGEKLAKAQSNAQSKMDHCDGNCANEKRNLARTTAELKSYDSRNEFNLRLREILRPGQAETYFRS